MIYNMFMQKSCKSNWNRIPDQSIFASLKCDIKIPMIASLKRISLLSLKQNVMTLQVCKVEKATKSLKKQSIMLICALVFNRRAKKRNMRF